MGKNIAIDVDEVKEIFYLLEELNDFFHDQNKYLDSENLKKFASQIYPLINKGYYKTVWNWLPKEVQDEIAQ